ncbi:RAB11-binding protein RELCH homolog isoform X1 [Latimeria chalumnae]|uniref:RAB11-binding protein RELCH homolog isoform X1 n=2 Tax=Latimeria chalumnae TaxID=7897 RepID=UPI0006D90AD3|nr:PREDICTED: lisH domain and HEAT repeat-containing protein KIAA1468 homolog [Latimeria chalumnae]|eukprot:XP_014349479.1 PREDICTED: lisH domain and HEAT repeat-containing protein KIAA1468 homolog [Latimeria chalumnae]
MEKMASGSVNPFLSDSEEESSDRRPDGADAELGTPRTGASAATSPQQPDSDPGGSLLRSAVMGEGGGGGAGAAAAGEQLRVSVDAIAAQLIRDQYILTALEFHTELLEAGRELPRLRDYFSNPGNFERQSCTLAAAKEMGPGGGAGGQLNRAGSISTLDSLDFARYSDDGNREADERVAVLEFELRKAKETIQALRANLTQAAENELPLQERKNHKSSPEIQEPIKPLEKRALNFLVNEYLLKNNYKLTSITFSDENDDQDFELWDDVGLNIPKPPDLLQLYRDCGNHLATSKNMTDVAVGVEAEELEASPLASQMWAPEPTAVVEELEHRISQLNCEKLSLAEQIRNLESEIEALKMKTLTTPFISDSIKPREDQVPHLATAENGQYVHIQTSDGSSHDDEQKLASSSIQTPHIETDSSSPAPHTVTCSSTKEERKIPVTPQHSKGLAYFDKPNRKLSPAFHQALLSFCRMSADSRLGSEVSRIADSEQNVMLMLGRCLPHIVPNVLLAKREELIPLILCTACLHPEPKERDQLLHILFNLIKRPDDEQRQMILTGCVAFARHVGPTRVEAELLPQCWEQINHKYPERRLLVAESCGALAPYLPKEIRSSLVLSMLQQMLTEDKADMVREAVIKSLGIIMGYIDDTDKYLQGFELLLSALGDPSERVINATHQVFLPVFAAWTTEMGNLQSHLIPTLLNKIEKLLREGEHGLDEHKLHIYLSALQSLIPPLFALVVQNAPFRSKAKLQGEVPQIEVTRFPRPASPLQDVATIIGSREQLAVLLQLYDYQLEHEGTTGWESLLWVVNQLLPHLIETVGKINVTSTACVHEFSRFFWRLCRTFGKIFTNTKVKPQFQEILRLSEENVDATAGNGVLTKATVPIYATGVLTCYNQEEDRKLLVGFLEDVMTTLSLSHAPLDSLKASFVELGANPAYHELLLTVLWYGVVHTSALVRCTAARMFELLVKGVNETLVAQRVVPALITLSSDPEISVRIATIPAFGTIMETVTQRELLERVKMQLASFLEDPQYQDQHSLHMEIIRTFGRVGPNAEPRFRDEFVLPHLHKLALVNNQQTVDSKRLDIATHLFEAYSALSCCFISEELMVNHFLPGLKCLRADMEQLSPEHEVILNSMIKECEQKIENKTVQEPQGSMSIAASLVSEDTKAKFLNKMGQLTTSGAMLANVFQRKK